MMYLSDVCIFHFLYLLILLYGLGCGNELVCLKCDCVFIWNDK